MDAFSFSYNAEQSKFDQLKFDVMNNLECLKNQNENLKQKKQQLLVQHQKYMQEYQESKQKCKIVQKQLNPSQMIKIVNFQKQLELLKLKNQDLIQKQRDEITQLKLKMGNSFIDIQNNDKYINESQVLKQQIDDSKKCISYYQQQIKKDNLLLGYLQQQDFNQRQTYVQNILDQISDDDKCELRKLNFKLKDLQQDLLDYQEVNRTMNLILELPSQNEEQTKVKDENIQLENELQMLKMKYWNQEKQLQFNQLMHDHNQKIQFKNQFTNLKTSKNNLSLKESNQNQKKQYNHIYRSLQKNIDNKPRFI